MDICETEGVIMKIKDYYKLSSTATVVLQKYQRLGLTGWTLKLNISVTRTKFM